MIKRSSGGGTFKFAWWKLEESRWSILQESPVLFFFLWSILLPSAWFKLEFFFCLVKEMRFFGPLTLSLGVVLSGLSSGMICYFFFCVSCGRCVFFSLSALLSLHDFRVRVCARIWVASMNSACRCDLLGFGLAAFSSLEFQRCPFLSFMEERRSFGWTAEKRQKRGRMLRMAFPFVLLLLGEHATLRLSDFICFFLCYMHQVAETIAGR